jgi:hypothetical protein
MKLSDELIDALGNAFVAMKKLNNAPCETFKDFVMCYVVFSSWKAQL